jgi:hypothetical protein
VAALLVIFVIFSTPHAENSFLLNRLYTINLGLLVPGGQSSAILKHQATNFIDSAKPCSENFALYSINLVDSSFF